jgi:ABC-type glycerol-3-phosphate transport system substrate-binding protein
MMKKNGWYLGMLVVLTLVLALSACGPAATEAPAAEQPAEEPTAEKAAEEEAAPEEVVELRWLQWWVNEWGPENHAALIDEFEKMHPNIKVTVVDVPWPDMAGKLNAAAAGGETYDVFGTESTWIAGLKKQGFVENLDPWLEKSPEFANSLASTAPLKLQGETRGLCLYLIPYQFAYNVDVFEEKGLEPPSDWDEFVAVLEALRDESTNTYGMSMPLQDGGFIMTRYFAFRLAQEGGQWFDDEGNVAFNSPEGVATLEWWKDFYDKGLVVPGSMGEDQATMLEFVASGQVPTVIDGPFIWTKAKQIDPDIKIAYAPAWKAKTGGYAWACSGVGMSAKSEHKEEAWEFLKYLYSDDVAVKMTQTVSLPWATKAALASLEGSEDPLLRYVPEFANQDPDANVLFPVLPEAGALVDAFKLAFVETLSGEKDAQTALDEAAAFWEETLAANQ